MISVLLDEHDVQVLHGPRKSSCCHTRPRTTTDFRHYRKRKNLPKAKIARMWIVVRTTRSSYTSYRSRSTRPMCKNFWRLSYELSRLKKNIWLETHEGPIENLATKERMEVRGENGVYVMDMQFDDKIVNVITLDSTTGCNMWQKEDVQGWLSRTKRSSSITDRDKFVFMIFERTRVFTDRGESSVLCGPHRTNEMWQHGGSDEMDVRTGSPVFSQRYGREERTRVSLVVDRRRCRTF